MSTASTSINPPQPSNTSSAASTSTTTTTTTTSTWSPTATNQAGAPSPAPGPSTASSVSSPPPVPGQAFFPQHGQAHLHPGIPSSSSSSAAAAPSQVQQHQHLNATLPSPSAERQVAEARTALVASIGNMLDSELRGRASVLHAGHAAIVQQERDVTRASEALRRENDRLARVAADAARQVKELGNVQNWAEVLEREFLVLEETVRLVRDGSSEGSGSRSWSGSSAGSWTASREGSREGSVAPGGGDGGGAPLRDEDGDARMEDPVEQEDANVNPSVDKGKAKEVIGGHDDGNHMEVDVPVAATTQSSRSTTDGPALKLPDVEVPGVSVHSSQGPRLNIPGRELSNLSQASLEDELKSAMDQPIGDTAPLPPVEAC